MKTAPRFATPFGGPLLAMMILASTPGLVHAQQYGPPPNQYGQPQGPRPGQGYGRDSGPGWDAPPNEFSEMGRRGFHDGIEAARFDFSQHRPLAFQRNPQYRRPPTPRPFRDDYRNGFQRGYERAANRMMQHEGPPPPPPGSGYPR